MVRDRERAKWEEDEYGYKDRHNVLYLDFGCWYMDLHTQ